MTNNQEYLKETAKVVKKLPDNCFQVKFKNGQIFRVKTAKRLRKILVGDWVIVKIPLRDLTNGQIIGLVGLS